MPCWECYAWVVLATPWEEPELCRQDLSEISWYDTDDHVSHNSQVLNVLNMTEVQERFAGLTSPSGSFDLCKLEATLSLTVLGALIPACAAGSSAAVTGPCVMKISHSSSTCYTPYAMRL